MLRNFLAGRFVSVRIFALAGFLILGFVGVGRALAQAPMVDITPAPGTIAITGGKLLTITHGVIENGVVLIEGGKIAAVGTAAAVKVPKGATIVDAKGMTVYPGLIDAETRIGLQEIASDRTTNDTVEPSDEILPQMHVYDAFHSESEHIPITRFNGITNAIVAPASTDTIPGQDSFIQLAGRDRDTMLMVKDVALAMNGQVAPFSAGPAENMGLHIDAKVLTVTPAMGKPILIEITVANQTDKVYTWWVTAPEPEYRNFNFTLFDDHNVEVARTHFHRHLRGEWKPGDESSDDVVLENKVPVDLAPGKQVIYQVNLNKIFQISHAGVYTLSISTKERVARIKKLTFSVAIEP